MKKLLCIMIALLACLLLMACDNNDETQSSSESSSSESEAGSESEKEEQSDSDTNDETQSTAPTKYTIKWFDEGGNLLKSESVTEGEIPSYIYSVEDTAEWDYTVKGWSKTSGGAVLGNIPSATEDASYYSIVEKVKQKYTVKFNSNGGSTVQSQTVEYGALASKPEDPEFEGHKFMGWYVDKNGTNGVDFTAPITGEVEYFAVWNTTVDAKALLSTLLNGYKANPYSYLPESMRPDFSANLVDEEDVVSDFSSFVNVSDITYGYGEQYHMILENIQQSQTFFNVLTVVESISSASITAFNNYIDKNPASTAHYAFENGIYNITIDVSEETVSYVVDYSATLPALGEQTIQIALTMDIETGEKGVRIQLGDANALAYTITENSYEFAIKYLGVRRAMFSVCKNSDGTVNGSIYEYLTVSGAEISSCAEFYITEDYVSVVGNKASGMVGFTGTIVELYDTDTGKLLGYEVSETLSAIKYDTLWFNLNDIDGINSLKYQPKDEDNDAKLFVNGSSSAWEAKKVLLSRRFDIEFRTQFVYSYDATEETYVVHEIQVPMIFVQEKNYETFVEDVEATNDITISVDVSDSDLNQLLDDYDELIPEFIENKENMSVDVILAYLGDKIVFE
ncbi:MAG: InlB B-repeat-containing protein [Clostridia bacterium]|nr:InlB B-repeat-containing protein [Clostridia bacterium]